MRISRHSHMLLSSGRGVLQCLLDQHYLSNARCQLMEQTSLALPISLFSSPRLSSTGAEPHCSFNGQMKWSLEVLKSPIAPSPSSKSKLPCWILWIWQLYVQRLSASLILPLLSLPSSVSSTSSDFKGGSTCIFLHTRTSFKSSMLGSCICCQAT